MALTLSYPADLPVSDRRADIMAAIAANQVTIIAGETLAPVQLIGFALALAALVAGQLVPRRRWSAASAPATP